ncbi:copper chaperone CopZ [Sinanaerobacter chloroacetimidivorans]|jgi:copper chaperone
MNLTNKIKKTIDRNKEKKSEEKKMEKTVLNVEGMSCSHCVNAVKNAVGALDGVAEVEVNLEGKTVTVTYDAGKVSLSAVKDAIEEEGYDVL